MSQMTDQEAHDLLAKMADEHHRTSLGGVNPPSSADAAAGTMKDDAAVMQMPEMDLTEDPQVSSMKRGLQGIKRDLKGRTSLGGVNPPSADDAASGTMKDEEHVMEMPEMDLTGPAADSTPPVTKPHDQSEPGAGSDHPPAPPIDFSQPLGLPRTPQPSFRDTELEGLQDEAKNKRGIASIGRAVTDYAERPDHLSAYAQRLGGGGSSPAAPHSKIWDEFEAEGEGALKNLEQRRKSEADMAAKSGAATALSERKDPNSLTAKMYLAALPPEAAEKLRGASPEQIEKVMPWVTEFSKQHEAALKTKVDADEKKAADARAQAALDETSRHNTAGEGETNRHNLAVEAQPHGKGAHAGAGRSSGAVAAGNFDSISDPGERETVRAIVEGRAPAPAPGSRSGQHIMSLVAQVAPDFDSTKYATYQHTRNEQSTNASIVAAKAVTHHIGLLRAAIKDLPESFDSPGINKLDQAVHGMVGDSKYTTMQTEADIVAAEMAQALGEKDVEGRAMVKHLVRQNQTKAEWEKSLTALELLRDEKLGVYEENLQKLSPTDAAGNHKKTVKMKFPNGGIDDVPAAEVEEAKKHGGKEV